MPGQTWMVETPVWTAFKLSRAAIVAEKIDAALAGKIILPQCTASPLLGSQVCGHYVC